MLKFVSSHLIKKQNKMKLLALLATLCFVTTLQAQTEQHSQLAVKQGFFSPLFYIDGEKVVRDKFISKISLNEEAGALFKKGVRRRAIGYTLAIAGAAVAGAERGRRNAYEKMHLLTPAPVTSAQEAMLYGGGIAVLTGVFMYYSANPWQKRAAQVYSEQASSSLHFGPTYNGVGLTLVF